MSDNRRIVVRWLAPGAALLMVAGVGRTADAPKPCCFANDRFAGVCEVVPEQEETCSDVLNYLNNPASTGRTYCGSTTVRGGWSMVKCSEGTPTPTTEPSGGKTTAVADRW
jgi:hypothetical protein